MLFLTLVIKLQVHARVRMHMKIHKNANARTVGPINKLLVIGECCFWTVSEESHACIKFWCRIVDMGSPCGA